MTKELKNSVKWVYINKLLIVVQVKICNIFWINNYNSIARKAGLPDFIDYDYNPPESLEEQFENSI